MRGPCFPGVSVHTRFCRAVWCRSKRLEKNRADNFTWRSHMILYNRAKRLYLLTLQVSRYCFLTLQTSLPVCIWCCINVKHIGPVLPQRCCYPDTGYWLYPAKHNILSQCWINAGPASSTLAQHWLNIGSTSRVAGDSFQHAISEFSKTGQKHRHAPWLMEGKNALVIPQNYPPFE